MNEQELQRRLEALGRSVPASEAFTRSVMGRVAGELAGGEGSGNRRITRWIMRGAIGLAACAIIGVFSWTLLVQEPQRAYGITDVRGQVEQLKSLYVSGHNVEGQKLELFVERPDRSYVVQGKTRTVQTAERRMVINDENRTVAIVPSDEFDARFMVEMAAQNMVLSELLGPAKDQLKKVRTEKVEDVTADVYETTLAGEPNAVRMEVWLNPKTGLPVKSALYLSGGSAGAKPTAVLTFDHIRPNAPAPAGVFDFETPAGYEVNNKAEPQVVFSGMGGSIKFAVRYAIEVGNGRGVLVCWCLYDTKQPGADLSLPKDKMLSISGTKSAYVEKALRQDVTAEGYHWRWSLLIPRDPSIRTGENPVTMRVRGKDYELSSGIEGVRFGPDELGEIVMEAQRKTLAGGEGKPMTLEEIEGMAGEGRK